MSFWKLAPRFINIDPKNFTTDKKNSNIPTVSINTNEARIDLLGYTTVKGDLTHETV